MDAINEKIYQANIELVDRNKLLEEDVKALQKRIDKAIEYLKEHKPVCSTANIMNFLMGGDEIEI